MRSRDWHMDEEQLTQAGISGKEKDILMLAIEVGREVFPDETLGNVFYQENEPGIPSLV